jgi:hypothetical protein
VNKILRQVLSLFLCVTVIITFVCYRPPEVKAFAIPVVATIGAILLTACALTALGIKTPTAAEIERAATDAYNQFPDDIKYIFGLLGEKVKIENPWETTVVLFGATQWNKVTSAISNVFGSNISTDGTYVKENPTLPIDLTLNGSYGTVNLIPTTLPNALNHYVIVQKSDGYCFMMTSDSPITYENHGSWGCLVITSGESELWGYHSSTWWFDSYGGLNNFGDWVGYKTGDTSMPAINSTAMPSNEVDTSSNYTVTHDTSTWDSAHSIPKVIPNTSAVALSVPATIDAVQAQTVADTVAVSSTTEMPTDWSDGTAHIDFSPLLNINYFSKFPFCLPTDLYNAVVMFIANPAAPVFHVNLSGSQYLIGGTDMIIDLSVVDTLATIARWFEYIIFLVALIFITRKLIIL